MSNAQKIEMLKKRVALLSASKGVANNNIINKINRKIRMLEKENA